MHLAMHDAYFSINSKPHGTYLANLQPQPKSGADTDSAIAAAAHATLSVLYPTQKAFFDARHAASAAQPDRSPDRGRASQMTSLPTPGSLRCQCGDG
jgi:vanadium chloroperoxidase